MAVQFSERQSRTIAAAITVVSTLVIIVTIALLAWLAATFLRTFSGVFLPLAVGSVAALVFRPYYEWLRQRCRLPVTGAVAAVFLSMLLPLGGFLWFFGSLLMVQLIELAAHAPEWWEQARTWSQDNLPRIAGLLESSGATERIRETVAAQQEALLQGLQSMLAQGFSAGLGIARGIGTLFSWAVLPVYFAFFLTARGLQIDTGHYLPFLKPDTREDVVYMMREFVDIIVAFFRGQLIVAFLQGLLFAAGFSLVGLRYGFVIGLVLGFLNIIPYLGSIVGLSVALPLSLLQPQGGLVTCALVVLVFAIVQGIEGWILTPKIMGDRTGLHFMAIIVAVFFWGSALNGILGMILAIPLTAFLASLWRLAREKYISEIL